MKLFKNIVALLQIAACAYVGYYSYQLAAMTISAGGTAVIKNLIFSNFGIITAIDLILISCASSNIIKETADSVKSSCFVSLLALLGLGVTLGFNFELYITVGAAVLAGLNLLLLFSYQNTQNRS